MLASVIVPSRGGAGRLPILLGCLAAQTHADWEAIVVLDGDIDGSADVLARFGAALPVRSILFETNRGRVEALNAGFAAASGEVLIRCDDDLRPRPDYVGRHVAHHLGPEPVGVVGLYRNVLPETPYARVYGRTADELFRREAYQRRDDLRWRYWAGNVSTTRATYDRVGDYDRRFRRYGWEDGDWGLRLARLGVGVVLDPELETEHRIPATSTRSRCVRAFHSGAARTVFEAKHPEQPRAGVAGSSPWNLMLAAGGRLWTLPRIERFAGWVDGVLGRVPTPVGRRMVGFAVESAFQAGYRRPDDATNHV